MVDKLIYLDGAKSIELAQYPDEAWTWLTGKRDGPESGVADYFKAVPWLYRGIQMRADAVSSMPFAVYLGDEPMDESETWENKVGFMPSPRRMLRLLEMSLCLTGMAYQYRVMQGAKIVQLKYLNPTSVRPKMSETEGLLYFVRSLSQKQIQLKPEEIVYYWAEDPYIEIGPPETCPAKAALMAAGVLANVDEFVAGFFQRGAIKAMLLTVKGTPPPAEKARLEEWWKRVVAGVRNAFGSHVVNAEGIEPVVVGEGLAELQNQGLTAEKREDISTALGVPQTKLFSSSASGLGGGGVVETDDKRFLQDTIVPECNFIGEVLNDQVFEPMGLRFEFQPETLDAFQQDERYRSAAYAAYVGAGMPPSITAEMLGLELPDGVTYESLDEWEMQKFERSAAVYGERMAQQQASNEGEGDEDNFKSHLDKWQRKALKRGPGKAVEFDSPWISPVLNGAIIGMLEETTTPEQIKRVFKNAAVWEGYS